MSPSTVSFSDVISKEVVENWGDDKSFDAKEALVTHMEERFEAKTINILEARDEGEQLILLITTDLWEEPREFALFSSGSLVW